MISCLFILSGWFFFSLHDFIFLFISWISHLVFIDLNPLMSIEKHVKLWKSFHIVELDSQQMIQILIFDVGVITLNDWEIAKTTFNIRGRNSKRQNLS